MTFSMKSSVTSAGAEQLKLLPLLPVRQPTTCVAGHRSHDTLNVIETALSIPGVRHRDCPILDTDLTLAAAQRHWNQFLSFATTLVMQERLSDAGQVLQSAHAWKNRWETSTSRFILLNPAHWITLSACSIATGDIDTAATFAIRAWDSTRRHWSDDLNHDFRNSQADAATLLALIRVQQRRLDRAILMLEHGIEGHRQVGDLEQLAADYLLLGLCLAVEGDSSGAADARRSAQLLLTDSLDPTRHHRQPQLAEWLRRYGQPRPDLMKHSRLL